MNERSRHSALRSSVRRGAGRVLFVLAGALAGGMAPALAQETTPRTVNVYTAAQLDQMLAPIALYPDGLLGQILMAATYPLEIVEADRWLQDPDNAALRGGPLVQALQQQAWDPSVKSLVAVPQVLEVLDSNLDWTEQVGEAFIGQQRDVMDRVQQLRQRAEAARTLISTPQQVVSDDGQAIEIAPPDSNNLYVPVYDPDLVYGSWPYADAPPYGFDMGGYFPGTYVGFVIVAPLWGWNQWNWHDHDLIINNAAGNPVGGARQPVHHVPWRHNPAHRDGVRYGNATLQARYGAGQAGAGAGAGASAGGMAAGARVAPPMPMLPAAGASLAPRRALAPERIPARSENPPSFTRSAPPANVPAPPAPAPVHVAPGAPQTPAHFSAPPAEHAVTEARMHVPESRGAEFHEVAPASNSRDRR